MDEQRPVVDFAWGEDRSLLSGLVYGDGDSVSKMGRRYRYYETYGAEEPQPAVAAGKTPKAGSAA